jgi:WG containing repeat/zinc-ribbon domain
MNLFCRQCGHKNEEDAGFCESCGAPLRGPAVAATPAPPPQKTSPKRGLVVIAAVILVIAGGLAAALLVPSSPVPAMLAKLGIRLPTGGSTGDMLYYVGQAGKWGYVDKHGTTVIPLQFDAPSSVGEHKSFMVKSGPPYPVFQAGKWVLVDKRGERLGQMVFDEVRSGRGPIICGSKLKKWGCVDAQGAEVIPFTFDSAYQTEDNLVGLMTKGLWGLADQNGVFVIPPTFRAIYSFSEGLALAQFSDQKWGLINREGKEVSKKRFDGASSPADGLWPVKTGDSWALADLSGEIIQPLTGLKDVSEFHEGLSLARTNQGDFGNLGYIDRSGKFVIRPQFWGGGGFQDGIAQVQATEHSGLIGRDGRYVVPPVFDQIVFIDGVALAWKGEEIWLIDRAGRVIWPKEKRSLEPPTRDFAKISASKWQMQSIGVRRVNSVDTYEFLRDKILVSRGNKNGQIPFEASEQGFLQVKFPDGALHNWELMSYGDELVIFDAEDKANPMHLTRAGPAGGERKESAAGSKPEAKSELFTLPTELEAINVTKPALQKGNPNNPFCSDRSTEDISFVAFGDAKAESGLDQAGREEVFALLPVTVHAVGKCSAYGIRPTKFDEDIRFLLRGSKLGAWTVERECKDDFKSCFAMRAMGF